MTMDALFYVILAPFLAGLVVLALGRRLPGLSEGLSLLVTLGTLATAGYLLTLTNPALEHPVATYSLPWAGWGMDFVLRLDRFSALILLAISGFGFLTALYSLRFMQGQSNRHAFFGLMLITLAMAGGAVLARNLICMLFFWEGLLATLFGLIAIGGKDAWKAATKAFVLVGISDLCLMLGIGLTWHLTGSLDLASVNLNAVPAAWADRAGQFATLAGLAYTLMMIGAIGKGGSMPFHSWIPDAAIQAPLPFMALLPAALEKLVGIYLLTRLSLDVYRIQTGSWASVMVMTIGGVTILLAVAMALIQKDFKRLLSYHAISQVGYMILGIGTGVTAGIVGGLFHMINNALYKSCLFLTGGNVEKQAGTTDLRKLGGLIANMPVTAVCFIVAAASISGFPATNGFWSKELIYDGALHAGSGGWLFYGAALLGSVLTAASFLKLGHAAFFGPRPAEHAQVKEAPATMLAPAVVLAGLCLVFGLYNALPLEGLIQPALGDAVMAGHSFAGWHVQTMLLAGTLVALGVALANHLLGARHYGGGVHAVDHIHHAPVLGTIYDKAERHWFDPYDLFMGLVSVVSVVANAVDRVINWVSDGLCTSLAGLLAFLTSRAHTGSYSMYVVWCLLGAVAMVWYVLSVK